MSLLSGIPIIGSVVDYVMGTYSQHEANELTAEQNYFNRQFQREENEKEKAWNEKMWQLEKQYNTPAAQMQRYREAGINPFLADSAKVGSGNTPAPTNSPMSASPSNGSFGAVNYGGLFGSLAQIMLQSKSVDANAANQNAAALKMTVEAANEASRRGNSALANKLLNIAFRQYGLSEDHRDLIREQMEYDILNSRLRSEQQDFVNKLNYKYGDEKAKKELDILSVTYQEFQSKINVNDVVAKLHDAEVSLTRAKTETEKEEALRVKNAAATELARAAAEYASAAASKASARLSESEAAIKEDAKNYFVSQAKQTASQLEMGTNTMQADYESNSAARTWLRSVQAKNHRKKIMQFNYDPATYRVGQFTGSIGNILSGSANVSVK